VCVLCTPLACKRTFLRLHWRKHTRPTARRPVGVVICKLDTHRGQALRGYVAMLVVDKGCRGKGVGE